MTKVVILAGGLGTRFSEETSMRPKPMIEIGGMPILWHIMKFYSTQGFNDFVICGGYKQYLIKEFFSNYTMQCGSVTFDFKNNTTTTHDSLAENWTVTVADTGEKTMTGGRLKRVRQFLGNETFFLTYGDGLSDIPLNDLMAYHKAKGKIATLSAVLPPARFGELDIKDGIISSFKEKRAGADRHINGGFMAMEPEFLDYIDSDSDMLENTPMERIAQKGELAAFMHNGFWQCMDKQHDRAYLEELWASGKAPWKKW